MQIYPADEYRWGHPTLPATKKLYLYDPHGSALTQQSLTYLYDKMKANPIQWIAVQYQFTFRLQETGKHC